ARLSVVVHPPALDPRAAIVDLARAGQAAWLEGLPSFSPWFAVEDESGTRLVDMHAEASFRPRVLVPTDRTLFVRTTHGESELRPAAGAAHALERLSYRAPTGRARGAIDAALRRGLFAAEFGPRYYLGHVDANPELVAVPMVSAAHDR